MIEIQDEHTYTDDSSDTGSYCYIYLEHEDESLSEPVTSVCRNSGSTKKRDGKKLVRFSINEVERHEIESYKSFSEKELSKIWWSEYEMNGIMSKQERYAAKYEKLLKILSKEGRKTSNELKKYRGLEDWTAYGSLELDRTIDQCISAVLYEQHRQRVENDDDPIQIAASSLMVTKESKKRARENGWEDSKESIKIMNNMTNDNDEKSLGSIGSHGTAAITKRKNRKKIMARLDNSFLSNKKKEKKTKKKRKEKKEKKTYDDELTKMKNKKKKESKSRNNKKKLSTKCGTDTTSATNTTSSIKTSSMRDQDGSFSEISEIGNSIPDTVIFVTRSVGPSESDSSISLSFDGKTEEDDVSPLISSLRRQQQKLTNNRNVESSDPPGFDGIPKRSIKMPLIKKKKKINEK